MRDPLRGLLRVCSLSLVLCLVAGWGIAAGAQPDESEEWQNDWAQVSMAMFVRTCSTPKCLGPVERYLRPSLLSFWPWQHIPAIIVLDEYVPAPSEDGERTLNAHDAANEAARTMLAEQPPFFVVKESVAEQDPLVWNTGYVRQSYSHFHADVYTDAEYVALVDTDTLFVTPVTPGDLLDDRGRPIMVVQIGRPGTEFWRATATKVEAFLKRPYLARGMANWPVVVRTEHLAALRDYVMQAHNTSFENVFEAYCAGMKECHNKIVRSYTDGSRPSRCVTDTLFCCAYDVMVTYLWYFHRDSYDWHFQQFDPLWDPELLPSQMQDYSFLNESNTHPVIRTGVHVGKSGHFHFGLMPTGNAEADIWVRWNDSRYRHVDFDHVSLCCDKQILWGFCLTAVWLRQLQVLSEDEARMYACQAIFASFEAFGSEMSNHSDEGGGGGKPTLVFGRNLPLEHASLFRFEMTDWRWDARTRHAAWEHYQRILKYVKRHGWAWSMAQIDHLFDQVLLSTADEYNEFVQAECLCHLQWPLGQFRYYDQDVWQSGRPDYFTATKTKLSAYRSVGSCSMAQLSDTHQVECTSRAQVHDNDSLVVPQELTETTSEKMTSGKEIYVSLVMCGRHDDERGDFSGRLQNSLDFWLYQARQFGVRMEIIVVEWNPFPGAPSLVSLLRVPAGASDDVAVRVITVKPEFHARVEARTGENFFEFMAKNVGARRARGKFVLFTNPDVLSSDSLAEMLGKEALDEGSFYLIPRPELPGMMDPLALLDMRRAALEELVNVLWNEHTCARGEIDCPGEYNRGVCENGGMIDEVGHLGLEDEAFLPPAGDFFLVSKAALHQMGGYHQVPSTAHLDVLLVCKARGMGLRQVVLLRPCMMLHQRHPTPQFSFRYILPGWEMSAHLCRSKEQEASAFLAEAHARPNASLDLVWGFPDDTFEEQRVREVNGSDWQVFTQPVGQEATEIEMVSSPHVFLQARMLRPQSTETPVVHTRRVSLWILGLLRHHSLRDSVQSQKCSFEAYSRWPGDNPSFPWLVWMDMFRLQTCRDIYHKASPVNRGWRSIPEEYGKEGMNDNEENQEQVDGSEGVYVSVVLAGRHDDLRGDYVGRLQVLIDLLTHQFDSYNVSGEVIVVDWAPVEWMYNGQTWTVNLRDLLRVDPRRRCPVRVVTVDRSLHTLVAAGSGKTYHPSSSNTSSGTSFLEYAAKNVGARRARGRFVLFTNGDVLLSDSLAEMLGKEALDEGSFYLMSRSEIPGMMDPLAPLNMRRAALEELVNVLWDEHTCARGEIDCPGEYNRGVCENGGMIDEGEAGEHLGLEDEAFLSAAGDFFLVSKAALHQMGGYHQVPSTTHLDALLVCKARGMGLRQVVLLRPCVLLHQNHPAPVRAMRYTLQGWSFSDQLCAEKALEAREWRRQREGGRQVGIAVGPSMDSNWGYPSESFVEDLVAVATQDDWQYLVLNVEEGLSEMNGSD